MMFAVAVMLGAGPAAAAPELTVKATGGIDGKAKEGRGMPVVVEIRNEGDPFEGDLIVDFSDVYESGTARAVALNIGTGETETVRVTVDSVNSYSFTEQQFRFFEGDWRSGRKVAYKGDRRPNVNFYYTETSFVVALAESADRLLGIRDLNFGGTPESEVIGPLGRSAILPADAGGWEAADLIIADDGMLAGLSKNDQEAIAGRIREGATLLIGMTDDPADAGMFSGALPLEQQGRSELPPEALRESGTETAVPAFKVTLKDGAQSLGEWEGRVLAAFSEYGAGKIVQTAFSFGDEPLASAPDTASFIGGILSGMPGTAAAYSGMYGDPESDFVQLGKSATERFETFRIPAAAIILIVMLYIILIGPVLYYVLRRRDRREQAWWIIPAAAVLISAGIFSYGAKDRLFHPQFRQAALFFSDGSGTLSGVYTGSVLTNRGGDLEVAASSPMTLSAAGRSTPFSGGSGSFGHAVAEQTTQGTLLTLRSMPFWSVRTVHGETRIEDAGSLAGELTVSGGRLTGTITNGFPFRLRDVSVWSGTGLIALGDLEAGEAMEIDVEVPGSGLYPAVSTAGSGPAGTRYGNPDDGRAGNMVQAAGSYLDGRRPVLIGHTSSPLAQVSLEGNPEYSSVSVIVQPFDPEIRMSGPFSIPSSVISGPISPEHPDGYAEKYPDGKLFLSPGTFLYEPSVPETYSQPEIAWTSLSVRVSAGAGVSILNRSSGEFEELTAGMNALDPAPDYFGQDDGAFRFRIESPPDGRAARLPEIELEGVASP
ncbi:hypothetical protein AV656_05145 [Bhargavaea cecembensis]|uniref:Uncharacterized protein n=1 Tax=Bhargavaea cecembensis TaxID=394098 RepID=A0A163FBG1_9BACL|nr:hypothetical protein AV656_05145 [Bhargavaea cecembensis]